MFINKLFTRGPLFVDSIGSSERQQLARQLPPWVAPHNNNLPKFQVTVLAIEREKGYVDLARAPKDSGRIPGDVSIEAHFGFRHDGHCEVAFGTIE